jgi:catechol 2,3-dioxygenase-like lactoylglutathione lyase family enzyme
MSATTVETLAVVLVLTEDTGRLAAFYRDVLGLDLAEEEHDGRHLHYACRLGSVYFTIQCTDDLRGQQPGFPDRTAGDGNTVQLCFSVPDMDAFLRHLRDRQVAPLHPVRPFEHTTFTTLRDPDGRLVRVMTPWRRA